MTTRTPQRKTRKKSGLPRCKNGTRRNKKTGNCEPTAKTLAARLMDVEIVAVTAPTHTPTPNAVSQLFDLSPATQQSNYLAAICSDSNFCTTFGLETDRINTFFGFPSFEHIVGMRNLAKGFNGFVNELVFEKRGYKTNVILKSPLNSPDTISDNPYFEAFIGLNYINRLALQFPCFLKTLGAFTYTSPKWNPLFYNINTVATDSPIAYDDVIHALIDDAALVPIPISNTYDAAFSCRQGHNMALLIEYIDRPIKFYHFFSRIVDSTADVFCELPHIFFQIYAVLATLAQKQGFTHYDLHDENIILYPIPNGQTVTMTYTNAVGGAQVTFKTRYIAKLVDYGRCFVPDNVAVRKKVCEAHACAPRCGVRRGYGLIFSDPAPTKDKHYIHSSTFNQSIDLKVVSKQRPWYRALVKTAAARAAGITIDSAYYKMLQKVVFHGWHGTPHVAVRGTPAKFRFTGADDIHHIPEIRTVQEMYWALFYYMGCDEYRQAYGLLDTAPAVGTLACDLKWGGWGRSGKSGRGRPLVFTYEGAVADV